MKPSAYWPWLAVLATPLICSPALAEPARQLERMQLLGVFDAGQPNTMILKLFDTEAGVLCYILMPEKAARKQVDSGWVYEGNTIGSISCLDHRKRDEAKPGAKEKSAAGTNRKAPALPQSGSENKASK